MAKIISEPVLDALRAAGLADDNTRRVVIDIQAGHAPVMYTESFTDSRILEVVAALGGVEIRHVEASLHAGGIVSAGKPVILDVGDEVRTTL